MLRFFLGNTFGLKREDVNITEKLNIIRIEDCDLYTAEGVQSGRLR